MNKPLTYVRLMFDKSEALPVYLIHYVNFVCNARCPHCFLDFDSGPKKDDLKLWEVQRLARHLGPNIYSVMLTGGEPFLRRDLTDLIRVYFQHSAVSYVQVNTNGSLPKRVLDTVTAITSAFPNRKFGIALSLDGIGEDHDRNRRIPGLFNRCEQLFHQLRRIEDAHPPFQLNINVTVSRFNQDKLTDMFHYLTRTMGARSIFSTLTRGVPMDETASQVDLDAYAAFTRLCEEHTRSGAIRGFHDFFLADAVNAQNMLTRERVVSTVRTGSYQAPCYAGMLSGVIWSNGLVAACEETGKDNCGMHEEEYRIGNLRDCDYDLSALWRSERAAQVRRRIAESRCFCTHECFMVTNVLFNPRYAPRLATEMAAIKLGRLVSSAARRPGDEAPSDGARDTRTSMPVIELDEEPGYGQ